MSESAGEPRIVIADDPDDLGRRGADMVLETLGMVLESRETADVALSGGATPIPLYRRLATGRWSDQLDWSRVRIWFGDERYVPLDHADSNARLVAETLLGRATPGATRHGPGVPVPVANIHPWPVGAADQSPGAAQAVADRYADELTRHLGSGPNGAPAFDLVLAGVGPDGHILSIFPHSRTFDLAPGLTRETTQDPRYAVCRAVPAPTHVGPHHPRLTLTPRVLDAARHVLVLVAGAGKVPIVGTVFRDRPDPRDRPAVLLRRAGATWLLDRAAASGLPGDVHRAAMSG